MSDAARDGNSVTTLIGLSNADGSTIVRVSADPTSHGLDIDDDTTGSDEGGDHAERDSNGTPVLIAVSSADGVTPVAVYADPATGKLLVDST